jgi:hypothetical protein
MNFIIICVVVAFFMYLIYNGIALKLFGVPQSLSMTYYLFQNRKSWTRIFFPIMMIGMAFLLLPAWLEISVGSPFQFLSFLAAAGIMFTGAAPAFMLNSMQNVIHTTGAICAAIFALLWVILVSKLWWIILIWLAILVLTMLVTKTIKSSYIYWLETVAFMSTFTSIITYYFI